MATTEYQLKCAQDAANGRWSLNPSISDPQSYIVTFLPPVDSMYGNGIFLVEITVPHGYPIYPPRVKMLTKIFHPNFSQQAGSEGHMYSQVLYGDYTSTFTLRDLMEYIYALFTQPDPDLLSHCNNEASRLYQDDLEQFKAVAREWSSMYAV